MNERSSSASFRTQASAPQPSTDGSASTAGTNSGSVVGIGAAKMPMSPTVIAVTSGKGGVGKTNISVSLSLALGNLGARVLCIDADLGLANMDIIFGVAPTYTTADIIAGDVDIESALVEGGENVWLLPGASGRSDLANLKDTQRRDFFAAVDSLDDRFDIVVVDTGAGVGRNTVGFASAARDIVIVVTGEPTSVADAYGMIKVLCTQSGVHRAHVLVNMVNSQKDAQNVFNRLDSLANRFLDIHLDFVGWVPKDQTVERCVMRGEPFYRNFPDCRASKAIDSLAAKLSQATDSDDRQGAIRLFWKKLLRQGGRA